MADETTERRTPEVEGDLPAHDDAGVDLTLIRWMLSMSPEERLRAVQRQARALLRLRDARTRP